MESSLTLLRRLAKRLHPHLRGGLAEKLALVYYLMHGYLPIGRVHQGLAQTDLTLMRDDVIILVEVKYRSSRGWGHVALTPPQRERLKRQMQAISGRYPGYTVRLELLLVFPHCPFWQRIREPYPGTL